MYIVRRVLWLLTIICFVTAACGCTITNLRLVEEELERGNTGLRKESGQKISGYLLSDGTLQEYNGKARVAGRDSLVFWSTDDALQSDSDDSSERESVSRLGYAIPDVKALKVVSISAGRTALLVFVPLITVATYAAATLEFEYSD